ncbi:MAG: hypothetical protein JWR84_2875 [Caulobacter sp.]|nr:hypothetical protein [Caulobacter sp.]
MTTDRPALRFEALDSWRGLCALWVVLYHFRAVSHAYDWLWVRTGDIAVDFFFVLSGFVLTHAYGEGLKSPASRWQFLIRRVGRLYPLHLVTLAAVLFLELARWTVSLVIGGSMGRPAFTGDTDLWALPANIFLVHALGIFRDFTWNIPSWSISIEWTLCLLFAAASIVRKPLLVASVFAAVGFLTTLWMSTLDWYPPEGHTAFVRGVYGFFLGALVYQFFSALRARNVSLPGWLEWLAPLLLASTVLFKHWQIPVVPPLLFGAMVLIFAAQSGPLSRALKQRALSYLGEISYSIYLVHYVLVLIAFGAASVLEAVFGFDAMTVRGPFNAVVINMPNAWIGDFAALGFLGLTIAVASATYHWVENPGRRRFNDLSKKIAAP